MKTFQSLVLCCVLLCGVAVLGAQAPYWQWAAGAGGTEDEGGKSIAIDSQGNQYVIGSFYGTATFGSQTLTSNGSADIFVAKLSPSGNWLWAVQAGGTDLDLGNGIAVDGVGNILVSGYFQDIATFGTHTLTATGISDVFVAKLDPSGNWLWVVQAGGTDWDFGYDIALDGAGNAYVTGDFYETATFGSQTLTSSGSIDIFVAKLDPNGNWLWAVQAGGTGSDRVYSIAVDGMGYACVIGSYYSTISFGNHTLTASEYENIFASRLDPNGSWIWAVSAQGTIITGLGIAMDSQCNAYVTGDFYETATFGSQTLTSSGSGDAFVAKLDPNGNWIWAVKAGGASGDVGYDIAVDGAGNAYITGYFYSPAYFGNHILATSGNTLQDIFVAKLDLNGNWLWAVKAGGEGNEFGSGIALDGAGNACITGTFSSGQYEAKTNVIMNDGYTCTFGGHTLTLIRYSDIFVAKLSASTSAGIPIAPQNLIITTDGTDVQLSWDAVTVDLANNPVNVDHYLVYYSATGPEGPFTTYVVDGSIPQPQWTHSGMASQSPGFYYVTAVVAD